MLSLARKFALTTLFAIFIGCSGPPKNGFILNGKIGGESPTEILLVYGNRVDTSVVKDGEFNFTGEVKFPTRAEFRIPSASTMNTPFYLENTEIEIEIYNDIKNHNDVPVNFIKLDTIVGTKSITIIKDFEEFEKINSSDIDYDFKLYNKLDEIISKFPSHGYSGDLLAEIASKSLLDTTRIKSLYRKIDTSGQSKISISRIKKVIFPETQVILGEDMVDFEMTNNKGEIINTTKYRGKMLLIDFWASWCLPCRKQNPDLVSIYNDYNSDFEILGVSIDKDHNRWINAINKDGLTWENVIEPLGYQSETLIKYGVTSAIPRNFLINESGRVVRIDIELSELREILDNRLSPQKVE